MGVIVRVVGCFYVHDKRCTLELPLLWSMRVDWERKEAPTAASSAPPHCHKLAFDQSVRQVLGRQTAMVE